jgi:hypothetical protein
MSEFEIQRCGRKQQCQRDQVRISELEAERDRLREVLGALGVIGNGYCFCSEHRDPHKEQHQPECRLARAALEGEKDVK